jgi:hypothetical protein
MGKPHASDQGRLILGYIQGHICIYRYRARYIYTAFCMYVHIYIIYVYACVHISYIIYHIYIYITDRWIYVGVHIKGKGGREIDRVEIERESSSQRERE